MNSLPHLSWLWLVYKAMNSLSLQHLADDWQLTTTALPPAADDFALRSSNVQRASLSDRSFTVAGRTASLEQPTSPST